MVRELLKDSTGCKQLVDEGESAVITATLVDIGNAPIVKAAIQTLTLTLVNASDLSVINGRSNQDILDANDGTVAEDGTVTLKLGPADNPVVGTAEYGIEDHYATMRWTWIDPDGDTLSGAQQWIIQILASA